MGKEGKLYYAFFDNGEDIAELLEETLIPEVKASEIVLMDANIIYQGSLGKYLSEVVAHKISPEVVKKAAIFAQQMKDKVIKDHVYFPQTVISEYGHLERKIGRGITQVRQGTNKLPADKRKPLRDAVKDYEAWTKELFKKVRGQKFEVCRHELYSPVLELINYLDTSLVDAREEADLDLAAATVHEALRRGFGIEEKINTSTVTLLSSDGHLPDLVSAAFHLITSYDPSNKTNILKNAFASAKERKGSTIQIIGNAAWRTDFSEIWHSINTEGNRQVEKKLLKRHGSLNKIMRDINQRVAQIQNIYLKVSQVSETTKVILEEAEMLPVEGAKAWLRRRYEEARPPAGLAQEEPEFIKSKLLYEHHALEVARAMEDVGERSLESTILKEVNKITSNITTLTEKLTEERKSLVKKGHEYWQQIEKGSSNQGTSIDLSHVTARISEIDVELKAYSEIGIQDIEESSEDSDKIYTSKELLEELGIKRIKFNNVAQGLKLKDLLSEAEGRRTHYTELDKHRINLVANGTPISTVANRLGMSQPRLKNMVTGDLMDKNEFIQVGNRIYISDKGIQILSQIS